MNHAPVLAPAGSTTGATFRVEPRFGDGEEPVGWIATCGTLCGHTWPHLKVRREDAIDAALADARGLAARMRATAELIEGIQ